MRNILDYFKQLDPVPRERIISLILLLVAVIFNAVLLWSEIAISTPSFNDEVLHLAATQEASLVLRQNLDPSDFRLPQVGLGFPLFHYYQHLPHLILTIINRFTSFCPITRLFDISRYFLLILYPVSIFWAMRRFGFNPLAGGVAAFFSSLISTNGLYGLDYGSYIWRGIGLYTQLWAMFFLPLALAEIYQVVCKKNHLFWAIFLSTIVLLSNLIYGYILFLSSILFIFLKLNKKEIFSRIPWLISVFLLIAIISSYFLIPFFLDRLYMNRSIWEESFKYNSFGASKVLRELFTGNLLDYNRLPAFTIIFFFAVLVLVTSKSYKEEKYRFLLLLTVFWLVLYFGRSTLGILLNILPLSQALPLHRFIGGFHLAATMVIGAGLALFWQKVRQKPLSFTILSLIIFLVFLLPIFIERANYYNQNTFWRLENQQAFIKAKKELSDVEQTLRGLPPVRVYAGLPATWGNFPYYQIGYVPLYALFPTWGLDSFGYTYHAFSLSDDIRLHFDDTKPAQYNLFNIRYVLLHKTWTPAYYYSKIKEFDNYILYEVPTTGYFDLVDAPAVFYGKVSDFYYPNSKWLFSSLPEIKLHPILEIQEEPSKTFDLPVFSFQEVDEKTINDLAQPQPERGKILNEKIGTNKYQVQFEAIRDCYLMLKSNYHPGWHAYLDYEEVSPVMLTPGFIGVKVSPGIHQALFLYQSPIYRIPLLIFGILILILIYFFEKKIYVDYSGGGDV